MRFWRRMEKISWTERVGNEEVLHRVKEKRYILHRINKKRKLNGLVMSSAELSFKHITEGKIEGRIEVKGRQTRRCKLLLDDLKKPIEC
jgi:hypothetical protein